MILEALVGLSMAYLGWSIVSMEINYRRASSMGIPLVRIFIDPSNLVWMIVSPHVFRILDLLRIDLGNLSRYGRRGWNFADRARSHVQYGPVWALISPVDIYVYVADADAAHNICERRLNFLRPSKMYKQLEIYGPCISTASWKDWPRHRKILATPFNESIMTFVWDESVKQTRQMLSTWTAPSTSQIRSVAKDTRTLSLNVLAATGFRRSYEFVGANNTTTTPATTGPTQVDVETERTVTSYRNALQTVLDNCIMLMVMPRRLLSLPFAPASWRRMANATVSFRAHMARMLDDEITASKQGASGSGGLMTSFVRALDLKQAEDARGGSGKGMSLDEIFGNIFVINFAGHDTTANTLAFATLLLAAYPDVQEWVAEELQQVLGSVNTEGGYSEIFPKLKRTKAVMLETLRLYPPIMAIPKWTNDEPQSLQVGAQTIVIPPNTGVLPSIMALQTHPAYWEDPLSWSPRRWISAPKTQQSEALSLGDEVIITPPKCTFFPWSDGPQNCPGIKFSQVEFVAVIASLLRNHRLGVAGNLGGSFEESKRRILDTVNDVELQLLVSMRDPDRIQLVCKKA
ncbi:cytochrome P450 [Aspergillus melleus]|uniref:cytochrome P450 n=1 Tax=Aspergillus melleus TaxID=138277 RepID=UPI001E8DE7B6|nr:uncharacterized protein LDX57_004844 [Aspergillus melleus]KAH8427127.1 hypothetical protein LDX57_004844 [Aspergillus melleus]